MDIEINNYASFGGSLATSISGSFTVNSGEERALYVCIPGGGANVTSATFNGVALSNLNANSNNYDNVVWYGLLMPDIGTYTLTVNFTGTWFGVSAICLNNVDQTDINLNPPTITIINNASNANAISWCGDLPSDRNMYALGFCYSNGAPSYVFDTSLDSLPPPAGPQFASRTALTAQFTTTANLATSYISVAGFGKVSSAGTFKTTITHNWAGVPPANSTGYLFINQTTTPPFQSSMMII